MKKLSTIIMALALVLGMSQCKKQETPTNGNGGEKVYVTLNVSNGESLDVNVNDNGGRHAVAPNLGVVQFTAGDKLYVGNNGKYIGQLTYNNGAFGGTLNNPTGGDYLHFYFLGNAELYEELPVTIEDETEIISRTISIADQSTNLPVLCYGQSSQPYTATATNYSAVLEYKCALVRFKLNKATDYICTLSNMLTEATIDFVNNAITPTATTGSIDLYREEGNQGVRWAILLPGTNLSADGNVSGAPSGTLNANQFINSGITLINPEFAAPNPANAVKTSGGVMTQFSVSSTQKVYFSRANLRFGVNAGANGSSNPGWSLHATQFDEHQDLYGQHNPSSQNPSSDMDRICWGRLSNDGGNFAYPPGGNWIYPDNSDLTGDNDWGSVLTGDGNNNWRMLTAGEWDYLFNGASNVRGTRRFLKVRIGIPMGELTNIYGPAGFRFGVLLLPDKYDGAGLSMKDKDNKTYSFNNSNTGFVLMKPLTTDGSDDVSKMLNAGAVFLPGLGYRDGDDQVINQYQQYAYYTLVSGLHSYGYYWSSTHVDSYGVNETDRMAKVLYFDGTSVNTGLDMYRRRGCCVRLVWDAN